MDGRHRAPAEMYKSLVNNGASYQPQLVSGTRISEDVKPRHHKRLQSAVVLLRRRPVSTKAAEVSGSLKMLAKSPNFSGETAGRPNCLALNPHLVARHFVVKILIPYILSCSPLSTGAQLRLI